MFKVGIITDVQYAGRQDKPPRYYRAALDKLAGTLSAFAREDLAAIFHLGDLIDRGWMNYAPVQAVMGTARAPVRYVLGNHDFKVPDHRKALVPALLNMPARYYSFSISGWTFVMLDGTELGAFAWPAASAERAEALRQRALYPPTKAGNGGIGPVQRAWLAGVLTRADVTGQKVALCCHYPIASTEHPGTLLCNAAEMRDLIADHASVRLWLNGHRHDGSYCTQGAIHHLNFRGVVETEEMAAAVLEFHDDRVVVRGLGREPSRVLTL